MRPLSLLQEWVLHLQECLLSLLLVRDASLFPTAWSELTLISGMPPFPPPNATPGSGGPAPGNMPPFPPNGNFPPPGQQGPPGGFQPSAQGGPQSSENAPAGAGGIHPDRLRMMGGGR